MDVTKCLEVRRPSIIRKMVTSTNLDEFQMKISAQILSSRNLNPSHLKNQKIIQGLREKIKKLESQLATNQAFLNMVIHDMRNPASSI
mmetsp:Transcript_30742/g.47150  ORF Transcript_30742/g.47150 Transcript_30742/m.47150 type:complete len:88 (-) Transcript_30742:841-1104(-)